MLDFSLGAPYELFSRLILVNSYCMFLVLCCYILRWYSETTVIMYPNVTLPLALISNKQTNVPFSPRYFIGSKIATAFKCSFEETMPKLSVNFDSHKNQYPSPVCNFGFTALQYSDKCWINLLLQCRIFLIGIIHRSYCITCAIIRFMLWLLWSVWNQLPRVGVEAW